MSREIENFCKTLNDVKILLDIFESVDQPIENVIISNLSRFAVESSQGVVGHGLVTTDIHPDGLPFVYKISYVQNWLIEHENIISNGLLSLRNFCPHFAYGITKLNLLKKNLYDYTGVISNENTQEDILFMQDIGNSVSLYNFLGDTADQSQNIDKICSITCQLLLALIFAQRDQNFTHYDMHLNNILIQNTTECTFNMYIFGDKTYLIPTYNTNAVIIDYGYSYSDKLLGKPFYSNLDKAGNGYVPSTYNKIKDMRFISLLGMELRNLPESTVPTKDRDFLNFLKIFRHQGFDAYNEEIDLVDYDDHIIEIFQDSLEDDEKTSKSTQRIISIFNLFTPLTGPPFDEREEYTTSDISVLIKVIINYTRIFVGEKGIFDSEFDYYLKRLIKIYIELWEGSANFVGSIQKIRSLAVESEGISLDILESNIDLTGMLFDVMENLGKYIAQYLWTIENEIIEEWDEIPINENYNSLEKVLDLCVQKSSWSIENNTEMKIIVYNANTMDSHKFTFVSSLCDATVSRSSQQDATNGLSDLRDLRSSRSDAAGSRSPVANSDLNIIREIYEERRRNGDLEKCF